MELHKVEVDQNVTIRHTLEKGTVLTVEGRVTKIRHLDGGVEIDFPGYVTAFYDDDDLQIWEN